MTEMTAQITYPITVSIDLWDWSGSNPKNEFCRGLDLEAEMMALIVDRFLAQDPSLGKYHVRGVILEQIRVAKTNKVTLEVRESTYELLARYQELPMEFIIGLMEGLITYRPAPITKGFDRKTLSSR